MLQQELQAIVSALVKWKNEGLNEAQTSQAIILRVLHALGYDIWNPFEVFSQEAGSSGIPDYIVRANNRRRFVIEVKRLGLVVDKKVKTQAVAYANNQAIRWAVLTNGTEWYLFDSFMRKEAHERLILYLSFDEQDPQLLAQYFERLLGRCIWEKDEPDQQIERTSRDIQGHIKLNAELQPRALELRELMREYAIQHVEAGLKLADTLGLWDSNSRTLIEGNRSLFLSLVDQQQPASPAPTKFDIAEPGSSELVGALTKGFALTKPRVRGAKSSDLEAYLDGQLVQATSWRDVHAGIAETFLLLNETALLEDIEDVYKSMNERRKGNGQTYKPSAYRQLQNGKFLLLHASTTSHYRRSCKLLEALGAPDGLLRVIYQDKKYSLP